MKNFNVIGVMSGTSLDGVDIIYVRFIQNESWSFKIIYSKTYKYEDDIQSLCIQVFNDSFLKWLKKVYPKRCQ